MQRLRRAIRDEAFEHDPDEPADEKAARAPQERLSFGVHDGQWRVNGGGEIDRGKRIEAALTEAKDRLFDDGNPDATWFDALVDIAERSMDAVPSRDRRDRYRTWFHVDAKTGAMTTTDGWRIPQNLARMCTCDGLGAIVLEHDGLPFSVGRSQYIVPGPHPPHHRTPRPRLPGARLHRGSVRRGPPHHPLARRRPDRHLEPAEPLRHGITACTTKVCSASTGNADEPDGIEFTDTRGSPDPPRPPTEPAERTTRVRASVRGAPGGSDELRLGRPRLGPPQRPATTPRPSQLLAELTTRAAPALRSSRLSTRVLTVRARRGACVRMDAAIC